MIEHGAIQRLDRTGQPSGCAAVGVARPRIAAGVVVGQNDSRAVMLGGIGDDFAQGKAGAALIAAVVRQVETSRLIVDMSHPQVLAVWVDIRETAREEFAGRCESV